MVTLIRAPTQAQLTAPLNSGIYPPPHQPKNNEGNSERKKTSSPNFFLFFLQIFEGGERLKKGEM